ncbi:MAG: hypothetical protein P1U34_03470 [Coxiellaceae bacterium]|nr:hypothetical protein [Coxiellaceae bacterium]
MSRTTSLREAVLSLDVDQVHALLEHESPHQLDDNNNSLLIQVCNIDFSKRLTDPSNYFTAEQLTHIQDALPLSSIIQYSPKSIRLILSRIDSLTPKDQARALAFCVQLGDLLRAQLRIVRYLLTADVDVTTANSNGITALHGAAQYHLPHLVNLLLKHKAPIDALDEGGNTPLLSLIKSHLPGFHHCDRATLQCATHLIAHGANAHHKNIAGKSSIQLSRRNHELFTILINPGMEHCMLAVALHMRLMPPPNKEGKVLTSVLASKGLRP